MATNTDNKREPRLFHVEWIRERPHFFRGITVVEALTETLALERFDMDYPNVKVVRVY